MQVLEAVDVQYMIIYLEILHPSALLLCYPRNGFLGPQDGFSVGLAFLFCFWLNKNLFGNPLTHTL